MALTGAQKVIFFEVIGLSSASVNHLINQILAYNRMTWFDEIAAGTLWFRQDVSALRAEIEANLATLGSDEEARLIVYLSQWEAIASSNLRIDSAGSADGVLTDHPAERRTLEALISNLTGVVMPSGGFHEAYMGLLAGGGGARLR